MGQHREFFTRRRRGRGFSYFSPGGKRLECPEVRAWIKSLAVPPQWTDVEISASYQARVLATGRDAAGRKQYIYNPDFRAKREAAKYAHLGDFGHQLGFVRQAYMDDIRGRTARFKPALALAIIDAAAMRVGCYAYTKRNDTYGAITLRRNHIRFRSRHAAISYRAKGGKHRRIEIKDPQIVRALQKLSKRCVPDQPIFSGVGKRISAQDVRVYLDSLDKNSSPKDFRTWHGSVSAFGYLQALGPGDAATIKQALGCAADRLGNTPAICRTSYVHPYVIDAVKDTSSCPPTSFPGPAKTGLSKVETDFLTWLDRCSGVSAP